MTDVLTTREIADAVAPVREHVEELTMAYKDAAVAYAAAKIALERAEAEAFLKAKGEKATDATARQLAILATTDQRAIVEELAAEKSAARLGTDAWQHVLDVYTSLNHTLNRELKAFQSYGGAA